MTTATATPSDRSTAGGDLNPQRGVLHDIWVIARRGLVTCGPPYIG